MTVNKCLKTALSIAVPIVVLAALPFDFDFNRWVLLYSVLLALIWWSTKIISRDLTSLFLLGVFLLLSSTPVKTVLHFPASANFVLIVCTFLISEGIVKTSLADRLAAYALGRFGKSALRLVALSFVLNAALIFVIPQPFPRVIILSSIYTRFLEAQQTEKPVKSVVLFSVYVASTCTSMLFLNGDVLLNYSALQFGNINMGWLDWTVYMSIPSLVISIIMFLLFVLTFKESILKAKSGTVPAPTKFPPLTVMEKNTLAILVTVLVLWILEPLHSIHPSWISLAAVAAMFCCRLLEPGDIKNIDFSLLLFMTAAFSIGGVLNHEGIATAVFSKLLPYLPAEAGCAYYSFITLMVAVLHMFLGSAVTTLSVTLPGIMNAAAPGTNPAVVTLIAYVTVSVHYLLPFHHATIMVGAGKDSYTNKHVLRYGIGLTLTVFLFIMFILLPWWYFVGI